MTTRAVLTIFASVLIINGFCYEYKTKYFQTKLDHFGYSNDSTFALRYLINDTYWLPEKNAPIFLYTGNEGDIETFAENTGFIWENAHEFNALILFAEHRYYGKSLPFGNLSLSEPKYAGYLSSEQALMDYVTLLAQIQEEHNATNIPVIAIGGSYGGMLAAWMRMKYPSVIAGSLASSAPIWLFTDMVPCYGFNRVTTSVYSLINNCVPNIKKSWTVINSLASSDAGRASLSKIFQTCKPLKTVDDVNKMKNNLQSIYVNTAMGNYPYPATFIAPLPANPVKAMCKKIQVGKDGENILLNLYEGINIYINTTGKAKCFDTEGPVDQFGNDGWGFQSCTEMVMPICDDGDKDMFEKQPWDIKQITDSCLKNFKVKPDVNKIRDLYGGKKLDWVTNIIFSNGLLDPWVSGGVLNDVSSTGIAIVIPESAHHLDLRPSNPVDPVSVIRARNYYRKTIKHWIIKFRNSHKLH